MPFHKPSELSLELTITSTGGTLPEREPSERSHNVNPDYDIEGKPAVPPCYDGCDLSPLGGHPGCGESSVCG